MERIKEIEARYKETWDPDIRYLLDELKRLNIKRPYPAELLEVIKDKDKRIEKLEAVRLAAKSTRDAIAKMKEGMIYANSDLGRILHSYSDLNDALKACEETNG